MAPKAPDKFAAALVHEFQHGDSQRAWREFLHTYAHVIVRVISYCERQEEDRADAFVFLCEQLHRNNCRRLRKFDLHGPASFTTWLHAVARNLCRDWRRKRFGRLRKDDAGVDTNDTRAEPQFPRLAWVNCLSIDDEADPIDLPDPSPSPEALAEVRQREAALARAISSLPEEQRLAISLRIEEDLTLSEIASLMRLRNAQAADRLIRDSIQKLRTAISLAPQIRGKAKSASV